MNFKLSPATINALLRGLIAGFIFLAIYLLIVVFTTPNLPPLASLIAAGEGQLDNNSWLICRSWDLKFMFRVMEEV